MKPLIPASTRFYLWLLLVLLAAGAASCAPASKTKPVSSIRVVMDNNYPPYAFLDESGDMQGIAIDQWRLWEKRAGVKVEITGLSWDEAMREMKAGKFDVIDTVFYTEERDEFLDYTKPYAEIDVCIFFPSEVSGFGNVQSLRGFNVAVKAGDANAEYLAENGVTELSYYDSYEEIIRAAAEKRESVFVIDQPPALYFLYKYGLQSQFAHSEPLYGGRFHRAVAEGNAALLNLVESGFAQITAKEYREIEERWLGASRESDFNRFLTYAGIAAGFAALIIAVLAAFNRELQARVHSRTRELEEALRDLKASETRFRELLEFLPIPIGIADDQGNILDYNRQFLEYYGYTPEDIPTIAEWMERVYPDPEYRKQVETQWLAEVEQAVREKRGTPPREYRLVDKFGGTRVVEVATRAVGNLWVTAFHDVTERKRAEEKMTESEKRYRALFEDSPVPLMEEDFSELKRYFDELKEGGAADLKAYFEANPEEARRCPNMVQILDVNKAAVKWYEAKNKRELLARLNEIIGADGVTTFIQEALLLEQSPHYEISISRMDFNNNPLHVIISGTVMPSYEENWGRVLVSIVDVTQLKEAEKELARQLDLLRGLRAIDQAVLTTSDLQANLGIIIHEVARQLSVDAAAISLFKEESLELAIGSGFKTDAQTFIQAHEASGLAKRAAREGRHIHIRNLQEMDCPAAAARAVKEEGFVVYHGVPLIIKEQMLGVLEIFHRSPLASDEQWLAFLETLAGQAAITVSSAALFNELQASNANLQRAYDETLEGWSRALDLRDRETEGHTRRVTELTLELARQCGFGEKELVHIKRGALLHDIGKMGIPDGILLKPASLTAEEWGVMRKHPEYAAEMLSPIEYLKPAIEIPFYHHERWDGSGYPHGLKRQEIPLAARIFTVVDVWDALTSDRPYRPAWSPEKAREYLRKNAGVKFDPRVVDIFLKMMENRKDKPE